jgi:hypothetical protein
MPVAKKRISSWVREPRDVAITPHRIDALKLLTRYKYLSTPHFPALLGGNYSNWQKLLRELFDGGLIDRPKQQRQHINALYRSRVYEITDRGLKVLRQNSISYLDWHGSKSFAHELMASDLMASFELGAKKSGLRLLTWADILKSEQMPEATRHLPKPCSIKVRHKGEDYRIEADGHPFGIVRNENGRNRYYFCPGIEADLNTEGLRVTDFDRSSIVKKFTLYLEVERQQLYRSHFGFPNLLVPVYTTDPQHLQNMKNLLADMTGGKGSKSILFGKPYPAFNTFQKALPPSGHALTTTYDRVAFPSFNFLTS